MNTWFTEETAAIVGAVIGCGLGACGGMSGVLAELFANKGRLKRLVYGYHIAVLAICVILAIAGIAAYLDHQPWYVSYVLAYPGLLGGGLIGGLALPLIRKNYRQAELRKSIAKDL